MSDELWAEVMQNAEVYPVKPSGARIEPSPEIGCGGCLAVFLGFLTSLVIGYFAGVGVGLICEPFGTHPVGYGLTPYVIYGPLGSLGAPFICIVIIAMWMRRRD